MAGKRLLQMRPKCGVYFIGVSLNFLKAEAVTGGPAVKKGTGESAHTRTRIE